MDKTKLVQNLKSLQRPRSPYGAFESYVDCMDWSDAVQALLKYDASLYAEFKVQYDLVASDEELEAEILYPATNKMLGILNRAVIELQTEPAASDRTTDPPAEKTDPIKPPDRISLTNIAEGVLVFVLSACVVWAAYHYLGLEL